MEVDDHTFVGKKIWKKKYLFMTKFGFQKKNWKKSQKISTFQPGFFFGKFWGNFREFFWGKSDFFGKCSDFFLEKIVPPSNISIFFWKNFKKFPKIFRKFPNIFRKTKIRLKCWKNFRFFFRFFSSENHISSWKNILFLPDFFSHKGMIIYFHFHTSRSVKNKVNWSQTQNSTL